MKSLDKLNKLADIFEPKINKYAEESDSTMVTLMARPVINNVISAEAPKLMMSIIGPVLQKKGSGRAVVGGRFITNAVMRGGVWKVDPSSKLVSPASGDAEIDAAIAKVNNILTAKIVKLLEAEFNKKKQSITGDTITNHETDTNTQDVEV